MPRDNKAVLISIHPKWCELIANGKKAVEVRKTKPKLKPPFLCYIYCTKPREKIFYYGEYYNDLLYKDFWSGELVCGCTMDDALNGKVIGEFVCDKIETLPSNTVFNAPALYSQSCLTREEFFKYAADDTVYFWHISNLVIYDKSKELSEFGGLRKTKFGYEPIEIKKAPRSWCYVEEEAK